MGSQAAMDTKRKTLRFTAGPQAASKQGVGIGGKGSRVSAAENRTGHKE